MPAHKLDLDAAHSRRSIEHYDKFGNSDFAIGANLLRAMPGFGSSAEFAGSRLDLPYLLAPIREP
jgi:hypothetical protein